MRHRERLLARDGGTESAVDDWSGPRPLFRTLRGQQEVLHVRDSVVETLGTTQRYLNPGFRERIGNSRRTGWGFGISAITGVTRVCL